MDPSLYRNSWKCPCGLYRRSSEGLRVEADGCCPFLRIDAACGSFTQYQQVFRNDAIPDPEKVLWK